MRSEAVAVPGALAFSSLAIVPNQRTLWGQSRPVAVNKKALKSYFRHVNISATADLEQVLAQSLPQLIRFPDVNQCAVVVKLVNPLALRQRIYMLSGERSDIQVGKLVNQL